MKVLFINPAVRPDSPRLLPNVGLAYVASAVHRAGIELEILDIDAHRYSEEQVDKLLRIKKYDAVGIGTLVSQYKWCKSVAHLIRAAHPTAPIIVGNTLGTSVPETVLSKTDADIAVLGEGDITIVDLLTKMNNGEPLARVEGICYKENGKVCQTSSREVIPNIDEIPFPKWDLFEIEIYLEKSKHNIPISERNPIPIDDMVAMPVTTARGCPFKCTFCYHAFQEKKYRHRSPESICAEIELYKEKYGANFINFWDELSFYYYKNTEQFADLMIEKDLGMYFAGSCRSDLLGRNDMDPTRNAEIARKLKKAGCVGLGYALENANREILIHMNKKCDSAEFVTQSSILQEAGIDCYTSLVFGYPEETERTIAETFEVLKKARIYPSVGYLEPMPGTPMYRYAIDHGFIKNEEDYLMIMGDRQDIRLNVTKMSTERMDAVVKEQLIALNKELETGLREDELIRTRTYRTAKTINSFLPKKSSDTFLQGFGIAAEVASADEPEVSC